MAQRKFYITNKPVDCTAGVVGDNQAYEVCTTKMGQARRIGLFLDGATNPFATVADLQSEVVWDALLALDTTDTPDNIMLSTKIYDYTETPTVPTPITSPSGAMTDGEKAETVIMCQFAFLNAKMANDFVSTINDNSTRLKCVIINQDGAIRTGYTLTDTPRLLKVKYAAIGERTIGGRNDPETNDVMLYFEYGELTNGLLLTNPDFDIFTK
jgi:hypothetical protein